MLELTTHSVDLIFPLRQNILPEEKDVVDCQKFLPFHLKSIIFYHYNLTSTVSYFRLWTAKMAIHAVNTAKTAHILSKFSMSPLSWTQKIFHSGHHIFLFLLYDSYTHQEESKFLCWYISTKSCYERFSTFYIPIIKRIYNFYFIFIFQYI